MRPIATIITEIPFLFRGTKIELIKLLNRFFCTDGFSMCDSEYGNEIRMLANHAGADI